MATESIFIPPHRHLWVDCPGSSVAPAPCPGHTDLFVPRLLQRRRDCCPEDWPRLSCGPPPADPDHEGSTPLLRVPTPEGSRLRGHHPSCHPEGWSDHVQPSVCPFQNRPSSQQSPACAAPWVCQTARLPWLWPRFSTGSPALFRNWLGHFETLFFKEKNSWTCSKEQKKKKKL